MVHGVWWWKLARNPGVWAAATDSDVGKTYSHSPSHKESQKLTSPRRLLTQAALNSADKLLAVATRQGQRGTENGRYREGFGRHQKVAQDRYGRTARTLDHLFRGCNPCPLIFSAMVDPSWPRFRGFITTRWRPSPNLAIST